MLNLLKEMFNVLSEITYKLLNTQSSVLLLIALMICFICNLATNIGKAFKVGDEDDNNNS